MATMILLPNETIGIPSFHWVASSGTLQECLNDDNDDTSFVSCDNNSAAMTLGFSDPDDVTPANGGVSEAEIDFDETVSVRFISSGRSTNRRFASLVIIGYAAPSGNADETCSYDAHASSYETINGTAREHSDGSSAAWTYADLEDLRITCTKSLALEVRLSYLVMEVTYTEAAVVTDNATFFGANF
jgi:hypothetical protein